jgi:hypothetical protein
MKKNPELKRQFVYPFLWLVAVSTPLFWIISTSAVIVVELIGMLVQYFLKVNCS